MTAYFRKPTPKNALEKILLILIFFTPIAIAIHPKTGSVTSGVLLLSSLFLCWTKIKITKNEKIVFFSLIFFLAALALSILKSDVAADGWGRLSRYIKLLFFISFYITLLRFKKFNYLKIFVIACAIANVILFSWSIYDVQVLQKVRASGLEHPIFFGNFAALNVLVIVTYIINNWRKSTTIALGFLTTSAILGLYSCYLSGTRGAWLALLIISFIYFLINISFKKTIIWSVIFLIITSLVFLLMPDNKFQNRITQAISEYEHFLENPKKCSSIGARLNMWNNSYLMAKESPILGTGLNDFKSKSKELIKERKSFAKCKIIHQHTAHSNYFHILAESGLLGLISLLLVFISISTLSYNNSNTVSNASMPIVFAFLLFGLTTTWLAKSLFIHIFIIYLGVLLVSEKSNKPI